MSNIIHEGDKILEEKKVAQRDVSSNGSSIRIAREYVDSLRVEMRILGSVEASTKTEFFGHSFSTPVTTAILSSLDNVHDNGAATMAKGAMAAGSLMWAGIGPDEEFSAIIETGAKACKIIKPYQDLELIYKKARFAEQAGAIALGMDVSFLFGSTRQRGNAMGIPVCGKSLAEMKDIVGATKLPFVCKGILSVADAKAALEIGAGGIVVSSHGGAIMDYCVPPVKLLPDIAKVIGGRIPIFVDGGLQSGMDAFKAIARGANGVHIGKALIAALAKGGAEGVQEVIETITDGLQWTMTHTGSKDLSSIDPGVIWETDNLRPAR